MRQPRRPLQRRGHRAAHHGDLRQDALPQDTRDNGARRHDPAPVAGVQVPPDEADQAEERRRGRLLQGQRAHQGDPRQGQVSPSAYFPHLYESLPH